MKGECRIIPASSACAQMERNSRQLRPSAFSNGRYSDIVRQFPFSQAGLEKEICIGPDERGLHGTTGGFPYRRRRDESAPASAERGKKRRSEGGRKTL